MSFVAFILYPVLSFPTWIRLVGGVLYFSIASRDTALSHSQLPPMAHLLGAWFSLHYTCIGAVRRGPLSKATMLAL
jgi:hypothetical protein